MDTSNNKIVTSTTSTVDSCNSSAGISVVVGGGDGDSRSTSTLTNKLLIFEIVRLRTFDKIKNTNNSKAIKMLAKMGYMFAGGGGCDDDGGGDDCDNNTVINNMSKAICVYCKHTIQIDTTNICNPSNIRRIGYNHYILNCRMFVQCTCHRLNTYRRRCDITSMNVPIDFTSYRNELAYINEIITGKKVVRFSNKHGSMRIEYNNDDVDVRKYIPILRKHYKVIFCARSVFQYQSPAYADLAARKESLIKWSDTTDIDMLAECGFHRSTAGPPWFAECFSCKVTCHAAEIVQCNSYRDLWLKHNVFNCQYCCIKMSNSYVVLENEQNLYKDKFTHPCMLTIHHCKMLGYCVCNQGVVLPKPKKKRTSSSSVVKSRNNNMSTKKRRG